MGDSSIIVTPTPHTITQATAEPLVATDGALGSERGTPLDPVPPAPGPQQPSAARVYSRNVLITGIRTGVFACAGVLLPSFLTHRLPPDVYGAWTLILQVAGYIGYLEFGIQIAVAKYIAEFAAVNDTEGCSRHASAGVAVTCGSAAVGIALSFVFSLLIPRLFPGMSPLTARDVSHGVLLVGISTAILLASSAFAGIFFGLQQYAVPMGTSVVSRIAFVTVLIVMVLRHSSLTAMGGAVAVVNVLTSLVQVGLWRALASHIRVGTALIVWPVVKRMLAYCSVLGIWTAGMLIITGLDTTIVGHVDYRETAFYAVAATPITFLSMLLQAGLSPLMPATSAMSVTHSPARLGDTLLRSTRYAFLILQASGLPLMLFGFGLFSLWVGPVYARHGLVLLRILVLAHIVRNLCAPYATMVIATGMQRFATWAGVCEAAVNLLTSVLLGIRFGAVGVALGTLIGAVVGVAVHFLVSMPRTAGTLAVSPGTLLRKGVLRPSLTLLPALVLLPFFWNPVAVPYTALFVLGWALATGLLFWRYEITGGERTALFATLRRPLRLK